MIREKSYILGNVNVVIDLALAVGAFFAGHGIRQLARVFYPEAIKEAPWTHYAWILIFLPAITVLVLRYNGFYRSQRVRTGIRGLIRLVAISCVQITVILTVVVYAFWRGDFLNFLSGAEPSTAPKVTQLVSRSLLGMTGLSLFVLLSIKTLAMRRLLMTLRTQGYNFRRVILVGSGKPMERFVRHLEGHPIWGLRIAGIITDREAKSPEPCAPGVPAEEMFGYEVIGDLDSGADALVNCAVDEVVFVPDAVPPERIAPLMEVCEEIGIRSHIPLHYFDAQIARPALDYFDDVPVITYWPTREIGPALLFKYIFDRAFGLIMFIGAAPLMVMAMIAIRMNSKSGEPVFYNQTRLGLNGRSFTCWKFRTMHVGAEERLSELTGENEADGPVFKMKSDPRITGVGRFLRKFSIDELPQLWNVLLGDMSLVGPRPPLPDEVKKYDRWHRRRLSMKPGLTCIWQVSGREHGSFENWMKLDLQYIDNWSLTLDFKILLRTVYVVLTGHGAM